MPRGKEVGSDCVEAILDARGLRPDERLEVAERERLEVVLASAWQAEAQPVPPQIAERLEDWRAWEAAAARLADEVREAAPSARLLKGLAILETYPRGWLRPFFDLDFELDGVDQVWDVVRAVGPDWRVTGLTTVGLRGLDGVAIVAARRSREPSIAPADVLELSSIAFWGDADRGVDPRPTLAGAGNAPLARQLVAVLEERFQRRFDGRDVLDAICLLRRFDDADRDWLAEAVRALGLAPEWHELRGRVAAAPDEPARATARSVAVPPALEPVRRRLRRARRLMTASGLGRAVMARVAAGADAPRWSGPLTRATYRLVTPERVYRAGYPLHGFALPGSARATPPSRPRRAGRQLVIGTPVGAFLLVYGEAVDPSFVRNATTALRAAAEVDRRSAELSESPVRGRPGKD